MTHAPLELDGPVDDRRDRVCVVGAGFAGVAMGVALAARDVPYDCLEARSQIGGVWRYASADGPSCAYASLHANTSKAFMAYRGHPMPDDFPTYPHHTLVARYVEDVATRCGVDERVELDRRVTAVVPHGDGSWWVRCDGLPPRRYRAVAIATGALHAEPVYAEYEGAFSGRELHVVDYDNPEPFRGQTVVLVGLGASSADIASELASVGAHTWLSVRTGHYVLPKLFRGRPSDDLAPLFARVPLRVRGPVVRAINAIVQGPNAAYGLPNPPYELGGAPIILSSTLMPAIAHGHVQPTRPIAVADGRQVTFADGTTVTADAIIHATGYRMAFPYFDEATLHRSGDDAPPLYHGIASPDLAGLYFIGLIEGNTAMPPFAQHQAEWIADILTGTVELPSRAEMWRAIRRARRLQDRRFHKSIGYLFVDPYPYERLLRRERRRRRVAKR